MGAAVTAGGNPKILRQNYIKAGLPPASAGVKISTIAAALKVPKVSDGK